MELLNPSLSLDRFFTTFTPARPAVLMLDYDGTLAPFTPDRDNALPYPGVIQRLKKLVASTHSRVTIISGRDIATLKRLLDVPAFPELWGCHGAEHFTEANGYEITIDQKQSHGLEVIETWGRENGLEREIESKPSGIAFHWRGLPENQAARIGQMVRETWESAMKNYDLQLHRFDGGLEIRPIGMNKGAVVRTIIATSPPHAAIAYLGDDLTDEDAFRELGPDGLKILVRAESRATLADIRITPPVELFEFLDRWIEKTIN